MNLGSINTGLLRFCMQLDDGPSLVSQGALPERNPEDYEWLRKVLESLKSDYEKMKCCVSSFSAPDASPQDILGALEELRFLVEDLDNANDYAKMGMGELVPLLSYGEGKDVDQTEAADIRSAAHWVISTSAQNNPSSQRLIVEQGVAAIEVERMDKETDERVLAKCVGAVSAIVRDNNEYLSELSSSPVLDRLFAFVDQSRNTALLTRSVILLRYIAEGLGSPSESSGPQDKRREAYEAFVERAKRGGLVGSLVGRYAEPLLQEGDLGSVLSLREQILYLLLHFSSESSVLPLISSSPSFSALPVILRRLTSDPDPDPFVTEVQLLSDLLARADPPSAAPLH